MHEVFRDLAHPEQWESAAALGRILLADGDAVSRERLRRLLEKLGYQVDMALSTRDAVEMFHLLPYDLLILDCQAPMISGLEVAHAIRRRKERSHVKVLGLGRERLNGVRERCLAAGMDDYLSKPVSSSALAKFLP